MSNTTTIAQRLAQVNFRPSGFDYMRLILATGVIYAHAMLLTGTKTHLPLALGFVQDLLILLIVPMFFALSGFLVAGSLERTKTLVSFLGLRVFRIMPVPNGIRFTALPVAYVTAYLGLLNPPRNSLVLSGDYSYGMYLYAYPIQQAVVALFPDHRNWYFNFTVSLPLAVAFAAFSWWCIEKPVMDRKGVLRTLEDWYIKNVRVGLLRPQ